nr:lipase family protein [Echinimonas agarilytica]
MPDEVEILTKLQAEDPLFISVKGWNKNSAQAIVVEHRDYIAMVFRGTNETLDWLDNLNAFAIPQLFGKFHRGFWQSLEDVWQPMLERYNTLFHAAKRPIYFTGHSLGGAMAMAAAAKFVHADRPFNNLYTFGQPRTMTRSTARIFNDECRSRSFRFHNNNDIVTRVPTRSMGYSHAGSYLYIDQDLKLHRDPSNWLKFLDWVEGALEAIHESGIDAVTDHHIDHYIHALKRWEFVTS